MITNSSYPQFYYKEQAVKAPSSFFVKNEVTPEDLSFSWYAGPRAQVTVLDTTPSEVRVYTLKVELPGSTDYPRAECIFPIRIAVLPVKVADGSGQLSMPKQHLNVQKWENADTKYSESLATTDSAGNSTSYYPDDSSDYTKHVIVIPEDVNNQDVISEQVLVKFLKNSIFFK